MQAIPLKDEGKIQEDGGFQAIHNACNHSTVLVLHKLQWWCAIAEEIDEHDEEAFWGRPHQMHTSIQGQMQGYRDQVPICQGRIQGNLM